jgi:hypothetical protein
MISKLQLFSIYSFVFVFMDSQRNFHVGEELTKIGFFFWLDVGLCCIY